MGKCDIHASKCYRTKFLLIIQMESPHCYVKGFLFWAWGGGSEKCLWGENSWHLHLHCIMSSRKALGQSPASSTDDLQLPCKATDHSKFKSSKKVFCWKWTLKRWVTLFSVTKIPMGGKRGKDPLCFNAENMSYKMLVLMPFKNKTKQKTSFG